MFVLEQVSTYVLRRLAPQRKEPAASIPQLQRCLKSCKTLCNSIDETIHDKSKFILHPYKWKALSKSYSYLLDRISKHLIQYLDIDPLSSQPVTELTQYQIHQMKRVEVSVQNIHDTLKRGESCFHNYCIPFNSGIQSFKSWLINTTIHLVTSTDISDSHLHDLLWSYATFLLSLREDLPISGLIVEICKKEQPSNVDKLREVEFCIVKFLKEEIDALDEIWKEANDLTYRENKKTVAFLDSFSNSLRIKDTTCKDLVQFIKDKLCWVNQQQNTNPRTKLTVPNFLRRDKKEIDNNELKFLLGEGTFGKVYKNLWMGGSFAGKQLKIEAEAQSELEKEAEIQARLCHPNILQFVCCSWCRDDLDDSGKYNVNLLTELIEPPADLQSVMKQRVEKHNMKTPFLIVDAVELMLQIAKGMEYLHISGIIHRDLKRRQESASSNDKKFEVQLKIADFGSSKWKPVDSSGFSTKDIGTREYMAPEVIDNKEHQQGHNTKYNYNADVYSFAILCWEVLTGKRPFSNCRRAEIKPKVMNGERPEIPEDCPAALKTLFEKCWHQDPLQRPSFPKICNMLRYIKACILLDCSKQVPHFYEPIETMNIRTKHLLIPSMMLVHEYFPFYSVLSGWQTKIVQSIQSGKLDDKLGSEAELEVQFTELFDRELLEEIEKEAGPSNKQYYRAKLFELFFHEADKRLAGIMIIKSLHRILKKELEKAFIKHLAIGKVVMKWRAMRDLMDYHLIFLYETGQVQSIYHHISDEARHFLWLSSALVRVYTDKDQSFVEWENLVEKVEQCLMKSSVHTNLKSFLPELIKNLEEKVGDELGKFINAVFKPLCIDFDMNMWIRERLPKFCESLKRMPVTATIDLDEHIITSRCEASCPHCGSACFFLKDHHQQHDCVHQPQGLAGKVIEPTKDPIPFTCLQLLEMGNLLNFHKHWNQPQSLDSSALEVRVYIFSKILAVRNPQRSFVTDNFQDPDPLGIRLKSMKDRVKQELHCRGINIHELERLFPLLNAWGTICSRQSHFCGLLRSQPGC